MARSWKPAKNDNLRIGPPWNQKSSEGVRSHYIFRFGVSWVWKSQISRILVSGLVCPICSSKANFGARGSGFCGVMEPCLAPVMPTKVDSPQEGIIGGVPALQMGLISTFKVLKMKDQMTLRAILKILGFALRRSKHKKRCLTICCPWKNHVQSMNSEGEGLNWILTETASKWISSFSSKKTYRFWLKGAINLALLGWWPHVVQM